MTTWVAFWPSVGVLWGQWQGPFSNYPEHSGQDSFPYPLQRGESGRDLRRESVCVRVSESDILADAILCWDQNARAENTRNSMSAYETGLEEWSSEHGPLPVVLRKLLPAVIQTASPHWLYSEWTLRIPWQRGWCFLAALLIVVIFGSANNPLLGLVVQQDSSWAPVAFPLGELIPSDDWMVGSQRSMKTNAQKTS